MITVEGIFPALVTPFDPHGALAVPPLERLLERVYSAGIDGVYVCGSTGEGLLQPLEQRKRVAEIAVGNSPAGKRVIVHAGAYQTAVAVELARHAAACGAFAVSSLPPIGAYSFEEILGYYRTLSTATDLPFLVYYFPALAPAITSVSQILELLRLPNVIGLKFTGHDLHRLSVIRNTGVSVLNGYDEVLVAGLLMGACGGIGSFYNLVPELFVQLYGMANRGDWAAARAVQKRINELIELTLRYPCFPALKAMLRWSGIDCGQCLEPRRSLTVDEESGLKVALHASAFASLVQRG